MQMMATGWHEADHAHDQTSRDAPGLDAETLHVSLTTSGLSYAEHMLHDTMQMTRRSAAAASASVVCNTTTRSQKPLSATQPLRAKHLRVASFQMTATTQARVERESTTLRANRTVPKPFMFAVDQRARSPRIAAHKTQLVRPHRNPS